MDFLTALFISVGLGMDCFAVSTACAANTSQMKTSTMLLPALSFGLFQASMFLAGIFVGEGLSRFMQSFDHWVAFIILSAIALKMIFHNKKSGEDEKCMLENPYVLLVLSVATSIDALVVGFSAGLLKSSVFMPTVTIGAASFMMTIAGEFMGKKIGKRIERKAQIVGGVILLLIGTKILISHLLS